MCSYQGITYTSKKEVVTKGKLSEMTKVGDKTKTVNVCNRKSIKVMK